jgi:HPt (histidine-containing phosphotransfer) domain-containing protein
MIAPGSDMPRQVADGLAKLREGFLDRVAERCMAIDAILSAAADGTPSDEDRHVIGHHAHKTAGVAATFGYPRLGALALATEQAVRGADAKPWSEARRVVEAFLDEMESVLDGDN